MRDLAPAGTDRPACSHTCCCARAPYGLSCPPLPPQGPDWCLAPCAGAAGDDIIDEVLGYFKANVLFKQFQPSGPADRVLVYLTLYTTQALAKCQSCETAPAALKALTTLAHENFKIPGDAGFTLGTFFPAPQSHQEEGATRVPATPRAAAPPSALGWEGRRGRGCPGPSQCRTHLGSADAPRGHAASTTPSRPCAPPPPPSHTPHCALSQICAAAT